VTTLFDTVEILDRFNWGVEVNKFEKYSVPITHYGKTFVTSALAFNVRKRLKLRSPSNRKKILTLRVTHSEEVVLEFPPRASQAIEFQNLQQYKLKHPEKKKTVSLFEFGGIGNF
jgi:hypothetical protein